MPSYLILIPVFLPILGGAILFFLPNLSKKKRNIYTFTLSVINLILVLLVCIKGSGEPITIFSFTKKLSVSFRTDELGKFFATLVSVLWPLSLLYGYEYMEHEERQHTFFAFYTMTLGAVLGISFSKDILTMYLFYEILTLLTFPLVMHPLTKEALSAGKTYLCYSLGGAAFAFIGIIFIMNYGSSLDFTMGGVLTGTNPEDKPLLIFVFFIAFCGFSVKAAMMPFSKWLIKAAVAPTPVTALLHAVAVVKAGAFAVIRLIYYIFGADYVRGSWAQYVTICLTVITILFGSTMAIKEKHLKRRLAYSTISNLSYILFAACLMVPVALEGAMIHIFVHAVTKIGMFFCIGAVMHITEKNYLYEIDGLGKKMKKIFIFFTIQSFSLIGIPCLAGFISKIRLLSGAVNADTFLSYGGAFAIIISALLTSIYLIPVIVRAFFPENNKDCENLEFAHDPGYKMLIPIGFSALCCLVFGIWWQPIMSFIHTISGCV